MEIVCLDLEGVLVPEIWIAFAEETGIPEDVYKRQMQMCTQFIERESVKKI